MILSLHRRYPDGDHWEIDPDPMGTIEFEKGEVILKMDETPIKAQIEKVISRPIIYIDGLFSESHEATVLKTVDVGADDYAEALVLELKRFGIEARRRYPAVV